MSVIEDAAALVGRGALLGLDPGARTIGVAVSDPMQTTATALETIRRDRFSVDAARLRRIAVGRAIGGAVVGLPLNMDGSEGPRAQSARAFARNLARALDLPALLWDERLSTVAAERMLLEANASRKRRAEAIDALAAQHILQGAPDRIAVIARQDA